MLDDFIIKDYYNLDKIIDILKPIKEYYPDYDTWIKKVVQKGINDKTRNIRILENDNKIAGITILKNTESEKKICSLFIHPEYRGQSWFYSIFMDALGMLKTQKPVITIPEPIVKKYNGIIFSNNWEKTSVINGRYNKNYKEYGFNEKF